MPESILIFTSDLPVKHRRHRIKGGVHALCSFINEAWPIASVQ